MQMEPVQSGGAAAATEETEKHAEELPTKEIVEKPKKSLIQVVVSNCMLDVFD